MSRKRDVISYRENPFLKESTAVSVRKKRIVVNNTKAIIDKETGEIGDAVEVVVVQNVDTEQFVKLFTGELKRFFDLTAATMKLLQVLLSQVQKAPNTDKIMLNLNVAQEYFTFISEKPMSKATFHRSINELLEKLFIAETVLSGLYYINPNLFFNGDRVRFVQEYRRNKASVSYDKTVTSLIDGTIAASPPIEEQDPIVNGLPSRNNF